MSCTPFIRSFGTLRMWGTGIGIGPTCLFGSATYLLIGHLRIGFLFLEMFNVTTDPVNERMERVRFEQGIDSPLSRCHA